MDKLNAPRDLPFAFKVFELEGFAWIFDDSERTYICSQIPNVWAEPLYPLNHEDPEYWPGPDYFGARMVEGLELFPVPMGEDEVAPDTDKQEAWDDAREEACANQLI